VTSSFVQQALIYLAAAVISVPLARRLGLGSALGYLVAGVAIGPFVLGLVGEEGQDVLHFAEFGVVLMLFLIGLEMQPKLLWKMRVPIVGLGGLQVAVTTLVIASICALAFGFEVRAAVAIGLTLALSSTAIVIQTLDEKGWLKIAAGRRAVSVLLFQDIAVIPILAVMPLLAPAGIEAVTADAAHGAIAGDRPAWVQALAVVAVVGVIGFGSRYLSRPVFDYIARTRSHELFIAASLLLVFAITWAMNLVGLSAALGTFLAGVVLADSRYRHELEANIEPFKGLLLGLFFIAVGAGIDLQLVVEKPVFILVGLVGLMVLKFLVLNILARVFGLALGDRLLFSVVLAQGGEFAFLLASFALQNQVLDAETVQLLIVIVVLSMAATPLLVIVFEKGVQPALARRFTSAPEPDGPEDHGHPVIIAGYGRFGQVVDRLLRVSGFETTLLDHDAGQIEMAGRFGGQVFYGDASRVELLQAAGAARARLLIVAFSHREKAVRTVQVVRKAFPELRVLARAIDRAHAYDLIGAGADFIVRETFGSALSTGEAALRMLGVPETRARRAADAFDEHDTEGLHALYEHWGDDQHYGCLLRENLEQLKQALHEEEDPPR